jgi:hypothetical protein
MIKRVLMLAMAISLAACNSGPPQSAENTVGGANVVSSAHVPLSKQTSSLSLDWGKKAQAGQIAIADVVTYGGPKLTITAPTNWKLIRDDSTATTRQSLYWHSVAANDTSTSTWQFSAPVDAQGAIILLDSVAQDSPVDMSSGATGINAGTVTGKSMTTNANGDLILSFYATDFHFEGLRPPLPSDAAPLVNVEEPDEFWVVASYQNQQGPTEDQVSSTAQLFNWVAAQVAIKHASGPSSS